MQLEDWRTIDTTDMGSTVVPLRLPLLHPTVIEDIMWVWILKSRSLVAKTEANGQLFACRALDDASKFHFFGVSSLDV
jgi:hypothetical protein